MEDVPRAEVHKEQLQHQRCTAHDGDEGLDRRRYDGMRAHASEADDEPERQGEKERQYKDGDADAESAEEAGEELTIIERVGQGVLSRRA